VESLRDHVRAMGRHGDVSLTISVTPSEQKELERHAGRWLSRLIEDGVAVLLRSGPYPFALSRRTHAA